MKNRPSDVEHILIRYATKEDYLRRMISDVESQWLFDPKHKSIFKVLSNYFLTSGRIPEDDIVKVEIEKIEYEHEETFLLYQSLKNYKNELHDVEYTTCKENVEKNFIGSRLASKMSEATDIIANNNNDATKALETMEEAISKIRHSASKSKIVDYDISEFATYSLDRYSKAFEQEEIIPTGIDRIDEIMNGGFKKPNLVALGCGTAGGKSIVSMNFGYNAFIKGLNVAYINIEMSESEFLARLHSRMSGVSASKIQNRKLTEIEILKVRQNVLLQSISKEHRDEASIVLSKIGKKLINFDQYEMDKYFFEENNFKKRENTFYSIDIPTGCSTEVIRNKMLRVKETRGCDVIIIDYAGIMEEVVRGEQSWNTYSNLYLRLKALARELDVVMITPVQSYNDGEYKYAKAIRDHIDVGLNWKRTVEDIYYERVRFWFTKLRHHKVDISEEEKQLIVDFEEGAEGDNPDLAMRNPIFAKFEADKMLLSNYDEIEEMERMEKEFSRFKEAS